MEPSETLPTVVLDPYLLMSMSVRLSAGALSSCTYARFAICDYLPPRDFLPEEYIQLTQAMRQESVFTLSVPATEMADLMPMRNVLVVNQIAMIAAARCHGCLFASDCCAFRREASKVLPPARILCGSQVCQRFYLAQPQQSRIEPPCPT